MKRRVLCVFALILYLLAVCTMLSAKIEEEMSTLVKAEKRTSSRQTGRAMSINIRAVYTDSEGDHLYEVREGEGWDRGLRTYDVPGFGINMVEGIASFYGPRDYTLVRAASRQPREGELAIIVEEFVTGEDTYLYYYKHGVPTQWDLPPYLTVIAQSENALLVENSKAEFPFLPLMAKTWTVTTDMASKVFSLTEAETFLQELPKAVNAFLILCFAMILYIFTCSQATRSRENGWIIWINAALIILSLPALWAVLSMIDLPASMLPPVNIFDWGHYREEYMLLFELIGGLDGAAGSIVDTYNQILSQCTSAMLTGVLLPLLVVILEKLLVLYGRKRRLQKGEIPAV